EIYNREDAVVDLAGWSLGGDIRYHFPSGATLAPGAYQVVARNKGKLADVMSYRLDQDRLLGDYDGQLGNGHSGRVVLMDAARAVVDAVTYSSERPWPVGADALGLQERFLPPELQPAAKHQFMGRSLERIDVDAPSDAVENWEASALDGATPGRTNSVAG